MYILNYTRQSVSPCSVVLTKDNKSIMLDKIDTIEIFDMKISMQWIRYTYLVSTYQLISNNHLRKRNITFLKVFSIFVLWTKFIENNCIQNYKTKLKHLNLCVICKNMRFYGKYALVFKICKIKICLYMIDENPFTRCNCL